MALKLPKKTDKPTPANVKLLHDGLTSVMAGHPAAPEPWRFYEELNTYLKNEGLQGPWDEQNGYPLAYGRHYCWLFNTNQALQANPTTNDWVHKTTILLQESVRDYVVQRFEKGTFATLTEAELRKAAFDAHPMAYNKGGLNQVLMTAPSLLFEIASIPAAEFDPRAPSFSATVKQVLVTAGLVLPQPATSVLAAAMPAHSGLFRYAIERDTNAFLKEQQLSQWLGGALKAVRSGEMDRISLLNELTRHLDRVQVEDFGRFNRDGVQTSRGMFTLARQVLVAANERKHHVAKTYREQIKRKPSLKDAIDKGDPGWAEW